MAKLTAIKEFKADVAGGAYPEKENMALIKADEFEEFLEQVDKG